MKTSNGKIVEATENEMYTQYLKAGYDDVMGFPDFLYRCKELGTSITDREDARLVREPPEED